MRPEASTPDANPCATSLVAPVRFKMAATLEGVGGTPADPGGWFGGAKEAEKLSMLASLLAVANRWQARRA